ncbi:MAG: family N-acetyltransferase [Ilumatobacteraceae bacterium]|nr:family N-acetyltransferase [Ilumatobacteraceae bacterium]
MRSEPRPVTEVRCAAPAPGPPATQTGTCGSAHGGGSGTLSTRPVVPADRRDWHALWKGYLAANDTDLSDEATEMTWSWLVGGDESMGATGAFIDGTLIGFSYHAIHRSRSPHGTYCYLEGLFISPEFSGVPVGLALVEATAERAKVAGAAKLYWHSLPTNEIARALCSPAAVHGDCLIYERTL